MSRREITLISVGLLKFKPGHWMEHLVAFLGVSNSPISITILSHQPSLSSICLPSCTISCDHRVKDGFPGPSSQVLVGLQP